jgi:hypothetical protein
VAKGYVRESNVAFPAPENAIRLYVWRQAGQRKVLVVTQSELFVLDETAGEWKSLHDFGTVASAAQYDFLPVKIASTEYLLIANGTARMIKWDGASASAELFGSTEGLSDMAVNFVELYYARLFAAGDAAHPSRLYYSQAPGDTRTIENWTVAEESENVSGGFVEVGTDSDPITGLFALSNQLLIFKRDSLYRLLGDRPGNFRIQPVNGTMQQTVHTACVRAGDVLYFLTEGGMYYFDGQSVQKKADADKVQTLLKNAKLNACVASARGDKLYFSFREAAGDGANDAVLIYDLVRGTYMLRRGFTVRGMFSAGGTLYLLDGEGLSLIHI